MTIFIAGNPILDLVVTLTKSQREKFNIEDGGYTEYNPAKHTNIYQEVISMQATKLIPGGAGQNTARAAQALLPQAKTVVYMGAVGSDKYAELMAAKAEEAELEVLYDVRPGLETGKSAVIVDSETHDRSMCTHIAAANQFESSFLTSHWNKVEEASILFTAGFFVTASPDDMMRLARHAAKANDKLWGTNLCAPFIVEAFTSELEKWLSMANFVVGNNDEWNAVRGALRQQIDLQDDLSLEKVLGILTEKIEWQGHPDKCRVFILTQGADPTIVAWRKNKADCGRCESYPIQPVPKDLIVDTIGCGDAFIGGLITGFHRKLTLEKCIELGNICGREALQNEGATFDLSGYRELSSTVSPEL